MRSDPIGIPGDLEDGETRILPPPVPDEMKEERAVVWQRYDPNFLRSRPCTLEEMEIFLTVAREKGAPDDALLFAIPDLLRVGWYAEP